MIDYDTAERLASLPLTCMHQEWPHKFGLTYDGQTDLKTPSEYHAIFYGCFDWHSAVHGHWLLASVLNRFPDTPLADTIEQAFDEQFKVIDLLISKT